MSGKAKQDGNVDRPYDGLDTMAAGFAIKPDRRIHASVLAEAPGANRYTRQVCA